MSKRNWIWGSVLGMTFGLGLALGASQPAEARSPSGQTACFRWNYPSNPSCGLMFNGASECKPRPSVNSAGSAEAREYCQPTNGGPCPCQ